MNIFITNGEKNGSLFNFFFFFEFFFDLLLPPSFAAATAPCNYKMENRNIYRDNAAIDRRNTERKMCVRISGFEFMIPLGRAGRVPCSKREEPVLNLLKATRKILKRVLIITPGRKITRRRGGWGGSGSPGVCGPTFIKISWIIFFPIEGGNDLSIDTS